MSRAVKHVHTEAEWVEWCLRANLDPDEPCPGLVYHHGEYHEVMLPRRKWAPCNKPPFDEAAIRRLSIARAKLRDRASETAEVVPFAPLPRQPLPIPPES